MLKGVPERSRRPCQGFLGRLSQHESSFPYLRLQSLGDTDVTLEVCVCMCVRLCKYRRLSRTLES